MGIGSILVERGIIGRDALDQAIEVQKDTGERLDRALVRLGFCTQEQVLKAIGEQFSMPIVDLTQLAIPQDVLDLLPAKLVYKQRCVPISKSSGSLRVATCDPFELSAFDELRLLTGSSIELVLADEDDLKRFIRKHYGVAGDTLDALTAQKSEIDLDSEIRSQGSVTDEDDIAISEKSDIEAAQQASVIKLVNELLVEAISQRATDIHIEPYEQALDIRYRIDGILYKPGVQTSINRFRNAIVSRVKIMANLNIAEKRRPQDGRITLRHRGHEYDLRVSIIPMIFGEGVVLRILDKTAVLLGLKDLGMSGQVYTAWLQLIERPHGILLVTGPTGSGKSTTLYASLNTIVSEEVKAITVEDPVEYNLAGVNQIPVNPKIGVTFAAGLRSILRHDPDTIMIGEIRDKETAEAAIQASLTGHLVFSTLHTNDAPSATTRLLNMGVEPYLVASSIEGVLAQRLIRRLCHKCRYEYEPESSETPPEAAHLQKPWYRADGCRECNQRGYKGRIGIFEIFTVTDHVREMIMEHQNVTAIAQYAKKSATLIPIVEDGFDKVQIGQTSITEILRATRT